MKCTLYLGTSLSGGFCFSRHYTLQLNWKANVLTVKKEYENSKLWKHVNNSHWIACIVNIIGNTMTLFVYQKPVFTLSVLSWYQVTGLSANTTVKLYKSLGQDLSTRIDHRCKVEISVVVSRRVRLSAQNFSECSQNLAHKTHISTLSTRTPQGSVASSRNNWLRK